jgi:hypothetical protein
VQVVAGFECDSVSRLNCNAHKFKRCVRQAEDSTGVTFHGCLGYLRAHLPAAAIFENVQSWGDGARAVKGPRRGLRGNTSNASNASVAEVAEVAEISDGDSADVNGNLQTCVRSSVTVCPQTPACKQYMVQYGAACEAALKVESGEVGVKRGWCAKGSALGERRGPRSR